MRFWTPSLSIFFAAFVLLPGCSFGEEADESDGIVSKQDRVDELKTAGLDGLQAGQWARSLTVIDIDLPAMARKQEKKIIAEIERSGTANLCLADDEAMTIPVDVFATNDENCRFGKFALLDGNADISLSCSMESLGAVDMHLLGPLSKNSYDFGADISIRLPMIGNVQARGKLVAKHIGDCAAK